MTWRSDSPESHTLKSAHGECSGYVKTTLTSTQSGNSRTAACHRVTSPHAAGTVLCLLLGSTKKPCSIRLESGAFPTSAVQSHGITTSHSMFNLKYTTRDLATNGTELPNRACGSTSHYSRNPAELFDAFDGWVSQVSNAKAQDCEGRLTRLTDLTVVEMGVYVPRQRPRARARSRSPGLLPAPLTTAVKSVKSVKPQDGKGWFSPPCRQTGCQFDGSASAGVVA